MFNELPPGVLNTADLKSANYLNESETNSEVKLFKNQFNIKEIVGHEKQIRLMDLKSLKLKKLMLFYASTLRGIIDGQIELTEFENKVNIIEGELKLICRELKSLEDLNIVVDEIPSCEFIEITKIKKLTKTTISWYSDEDQRDQERINESLSFLQSNSLTHLEVNCLDTQLSPLTLVQLGLNCPQLKNLSFELKSSMMCLNSIVQNFKKLENLDFFISYRECGSFTFQEGLMNDSLKKLCIQGPTKEIQDLPKLIGCCKNLKHFATSLRLSDESLKEILLAVPNLDTLRLEFVRFQVSSDHKVSLRTIEVLKKFGGNLTTFVCEFDEISAKIGIDLIWKTFGSQFSNYILDSKYRNLQMLN